MTIARPALLSEPLTIPIDRLAVRVGRMDRPAMLEGGPDFGPSGRFSVYAAWPRLIFEATDAAWSVRELPSNVATRAGAGDPLQELGRLLDRFGLSRPDEPAGAGMFQGGMIGFFGYDLAPRLERLPRRHARDSGLPDIRFGLYDTGVTVDHRDGSARLWGRDFLGEGADAVRERMRRFEVALRDNEPEPPARSRLGALASNFTPEAYRAAVRRAIEYIAAGDVFQVNLTQRFAAEGRPEALDLYLRLRDVSPAPYAAFLRWDDCAVASASPELFYETRGDRLVTRPIKGTRPRGRSPEEDQRLAAELRASAKDRAELTMIVDLERNDLGRVCRYGTVRVTEALAVESYAQVHHLVATVEGRLRAECGPIDVVRAVFPGGSITGAPKIRAMEIVDELEPTCRSLYTGAIGYYGVGGSSAFNIAIRTMLVEGGRVTYQVGGGIVADSEPELEYQETLHKGRGLREVIEGQGRTA